MLLSRVVVSICAVGLMGVGAGVVSGQGFPNKPIRIVAGVSTSAASAMARLIGQEISGTLGQPIIIENRGGGNAPGVIVSKASPDGYTLLNSGGGFWLAPLMQAMPYDPVKDFAPITLMGRSPQILVGSSTMPAKSIKELIALAKAKPGELNYSIGGIGGASHLQGELFKALAGVNIVHVPYSSGSQEIADLLSGRVQMTFTNAGAVMEQVKAGKLRLLAVTSAEPSALVPGVPTIAASLPGFNFVQNHVIFAPAKTPAAIIKRLNQEMVRVITRPDLKEKLLSMGIEAVGSSPEQLAATIKSDIARWDNVIKNAGIKVN